MTAARAIADLTNVYNKSVSDAKYSTIVRQGMFNVVPTSITGGTVTENGEISFSSSSKISIDGCFPTTHENFLLLFNSTSSVTNTTVNTKFRLNGTDSTGSGYGMLYTAIESGSSSVGNTTAQTQWVFQVGAGLTTLRLDLANPNSTGYHQAGLQMALTNSGGQRVWDGNAIEASTTTAWDGISFTPSGATLSGTIRIYGYNNGDV